MGFLNDTKIIVKHFTINQIVKCSKKIKKLINSLEDFEIDNIYLSKYDGMFTLFAISKFRKINVRDTIYINKNYPKKLYNDSTGVLYIEESKSKVSVKSDFHDSEKTYKKSEFEMRLSFFNNSLWADTILDYRISITKSRIFSNRNNLYGDRNYIKNTSDPYRILTELNGFRPSFIRDLNMKKTTECSLNNIRIIYLFEKNKLLLIIKDKFKWKGLEITDVEFNYIENSKKIDDIIVNTSNGKFLIH